MKPESKTSKNLRKNFAKKRKILLIFGGFYEKTAKNPIFFEIF